MNLRQFLLWSARLERDAELVYHRAAALAQLRDKTDAASFFAEMAGYCHLHMSEILERAGIAEGEDIPHPGDSAMPAPEAIDVAQIALVSDLDGAIALAMAAEKCGLAFYESQALNNTSAEVGQMAATFADEERGHVLALERFLGLKPY